MDDLQSLLAFAAAIFIAPLLLLVYLINKG